MSAKTERLSFLITVVFILSFSGADTVLADQPHSGEKAAIYTKGMEIGNPISANGNLASVTDPEGNSVQYGYDLMDSLTAVTDRRSIHGELYV